MDMARIVGGGASAACARARLRLRIGAVEHALDIAGDQVDLEVDAAAGGEAAAASVFCDGVRDQVDADLAAVGAVVDAVDREAHAVDRDRALVGEESRQRAGRRDAQLPAFADRREVGDRADAVDVAADDVAAEPVVGAQGLFEVDRAGLGRGRRSCPAISAEMSM